MFKRFTDQAKLVMRLANQESIRRKGECIGTVDILLGLLKAVDRPGMVTGVILQN